MYQTQLLYVVILTVFGLLGIFFRAGSTYGISTAFPYYINAKLKNLTVGDAYYISNQSVAGYPNILTLDVNDNVVRSFNETADSVIYKDYGVVIQANEVSLIVQSRNSAGDSPHGIKKGSQSNARELNGSGQITCVGDSLTYGAGATRGTTSYPAVLANLTGMVVNNFAVGGEGSAQVAARHGGNPFIVAPFTIPATTATVNITLTNVRGDALTTEAQGWWTESGINPCFINGVQGNIQYSAGVNNFSRITAGSAVPVTRPTIVLTDCMKNHLSDITIIWTGTNGIKLAADVDDVVKLQRSMINALTHKMPAVLTYLPVMS